MISSKLSKPWVEYSTRMYEYSKHFLQRRTFTKGFLRKDNFVTVLYMVTRKTENAVKSAKWKIFKPSLYTEIRYIHIRYRQTLLYGLCSFQFTLAGCSHVKARSDLWDPLHHLGGVFLIWSVRTIFSKPKKKKEFPSDFYRSWYPFCWSRRFRVAYGMIIIRAANLQQLDCTSNLGYGRTWTIPSFIFQHSRSTLGNCGGEERGLKVFDGQPGQLGSTDHGTSQPRWEGRIDVKTDMCIGMQERNRCGKKNKKFNGWWSDDIIVGRRPVRV